MTVRVRVLVSHHAFAPNMRSRSLCCLCLSGRCCGDDNQWHTYSMSAGKSLNCDTGVYFDDHKGGKASEFTWSGQSDKPPQNVYRAAPGVGTEWGGTCTCPDGSKYQVKTCSMDRPGHIFLVVRVLAFHGGGSQSANAARLGRTPCVSGVHACPLSALLTTPAPTRTHR